MKTDIVLKTISKYNMTADAKNVVVGFSGGADSVCLLHVLCALKEVLNINIFACHLNHMLRGDEADRDEKFCVEFCEKLAVPLIVKRLDIKKLAKDEKKSVELCAREKRYEFFEECAKENNAIIATAHTKSDNMETVVLNMMRGTSLKGLCGIPPKRSNIIRPLIEINRSDVEEYCEENSLKFVSDSTNFTDDYTRNYIRHNIIPLLKKDGMFENVFSNIVSSLSNDEEFLELETTKTLKKAIIREDCYSVEVLKSVHTAILNRAILKLLKYKDLTVDFERVALLNDIINLGEGKIQLSQNVFCVVKNGELFFEEPTVLQDYFEVELKENGENTVFEGKKISLLEENKENLLTFLKLPKKDLKNLIDCGKINGVLKARQRINGDEVELAFRKCHKSLKKLFNESKISLEQRAETVVLVDDLGIVWVEGFGVCERCCVDKNTKKAYSVKII